MSKLRIHPKAIVSVLLIGTTLVCKAYHPYLSGTIQTKKNTDNKPTSSHSMYIEETSVDTVDEKIIKMLSLEDNNHTKEIKTGVCIKCVDEYTGNNVSDTALEIYTKQNKKVYEYCSNNEPAVIELDEGDYYLKQVRNNIAYFPKEDITAFKVKNNEINSLRIENKKSKTGLLIYNTDPNTGENISNLYVAIISEDKDNFYCYTSSIEPRCVHLAPGIYNVYVSQNTEEIFDDYVEVSGDSLIKIETVGDKKKTKIS